MLNSYGRAIVVLVVICAGAAIGMIAQRVQPDHHRDERTKDVVKLVIGLMATMTALILSLLIASAHSFFDGQRQELQQMSSDVFLVDAALAEYGPGAAAVRLRFKADAQAMIASMDPKQERAAFSHDTVEKTGVTALFALLGGLVPASDAQRSALAHAQAAINDLATTRLLVHQQATVQWPAPLALTLLCWLALLFLFFGLFAPLNATVVISLFIGAVSVSAAMFLMLSMSHPFAGFMRLSDAQLRVAIAEIGE